MGSRAVYILCHEKKRTHPHFAPWVEHVEAPIRFVVPESAAWEPPSDAGLVVAIDHYHPPAPELLQRLEKESKVPVLILADGILEYRNTWAKPDLYPGAVFQPVRGHKIACLGRSQARSLEAWGNLGKCELVGCPRFDALLEAEPRKRVDGEAFRVLVMTARDPGFTPEQVSVTLRSLRDVRDWFANHPQIGDQQIKPAWRIAPGLEDELGVQNDPTGVNIGDLPAALKKADAVITMPSTAMLEAMLHGLPVATLDYHNSPHYVPAAWNIAAPVHLDHVAPELLDPPKPKMLFQNTALHDALECNTPATPRMTKLVDSMLADDVMASGTVSLPRRILEDPQEGSHLPEPSYDFDALFSGHSALNVPGESTPKGNEPKEWRPARLVAERDRWKANYERLARTFPVNALLWVRRRLLGIPDPDREQT